MSTQLKMTEDNQKKLYEHFVKTGQTERAEEVLTRYPQFKVNSEEEEVKPIKSKKGK